MPKQGIRRGKKCRGLCKSSRACGRQIASSSSGDNSDDATKIQSKQDLFAVVIDYLLAPSSLQTFFNKAIKPEILDSVKSNEIFYKALFQALQESMSKPNLPPRIQYKMPTCLMEFLLCEDVHFQEMLHLSRKTVKAIITNLRGIPHAIDEDTPSGSHEPEENDEPIDRMVYLLLWYLRSKDSRLEDAVTMFELGSVENARRLLDRCMELMVLLKEDSGLIFPSTEEQLVTAATILRRYGLPGAAGVMGYQIVKSIGGQRLMLQGLCNEKYILVDLHISFDTRPHIAFQLSSVQNQLHKLEHGLGFACNELSFPQRLRTNLLYPVTDEDEPSFSMYNTCHKAASYMITETFKQLLNRFERLKVMETCDQNVIMAACVVYNYANKYNDLTPF